MNTPTPYCGPAPTLATLAGDWNFDPLVIVPLIVAAFMLRHSRTGLAGILVLAIAFVSPLCAMASALFSARVAHHLLLVAVAAPLLAAAIPGKARLHLPFLVHVAAMWIWHAPAPYAFALSSDAAYWLMQITLLGTAVWLWQAILAADTGMRVALALGTTIQMGMLGALLTFAARPLYAAHQLTTAPFGLSPLEDQQLAGLLMWVPAALPYLAIAIAPLLRGARA